VLLFSSQSKSQKQQTASLGLFSYPVLMAADILLYKYGCMPTLRSVLSAPT
jgi:tryptophanyl-tRNA synthetase